MTSTRPAWQGIALKALAFIPIFLVLHFAYRWLPYPWLMWFTGTSESVFEHAKIAFFAYLLLNGLEYLVRRRSIASVQRFVDARLAAALFLPWNMTVLWYLAPALYGKPMPSDALEVVYANLVLLVLLAVTGVLERSLEQHTFSRPARIALWLLAGTFLLEAVIFSYRLPWADFFASPPR